MSIENNLTPNELAKLNAFLQVELTFFDGVNDASFAGSNVTDKEEQETYRHLDKHTKALAKQWGMSKIFAKCGMDRKY